MRREREFGPRPAAAEQGRLSMKNALFGASALVFALALSVPGHAQQKTLTIGAYGGSFEQTMRKEIIPAFEAKHGVKVEYVAGNSTDTLAKLQAQKGNQQIDAIIVDDGPAYQAVALGFCADLAPADIYKDVYEVMKFKSNKAVGIGVVGTGFMYNKKFFDENKWPAPTSWNDLADPK
jgi:putative spermidine/putrescine transport system substrate-binding protein